MGLGLLQPLLEADAVSPQILDKQLQPSHVGSAGGQGAGEGRPAAATAAAGWIFSYVYYISILCLFLFQRNPEKVLLSWRRLQKEHDFKGFRKVIFIFLAPAPEKT